MKLTSMAAATIMTLSISSTAQADRLFDFIKNNVNVNNGNVRLNDPVRAIESLIGSHEGLEQGVVNPGEVSGHDGKGITIYTTTRCGYCTQARNFLQSRGYNYREFDVEKNPVGRNDYRALNGRGVPVILVADERMDGYDAGSLQAMINRTGLAQSRR